MNKTRRKKKRMEILEKKERILKNDIFQASEDVYIQFSHSMTV